MDELQIQVTDQPAETDWQWLEDNINQFLLKRRTPARIVCNRPEQKHLEA